MDVSKTDICRISEYSNKERTHILSHAIHDVYKRKTKKQFNRTTQKRGEISEENIHIELVYSKSMSSVNPQRGETD